MNDADFNDWLERSRRRPLRMDEEAELEIWLAAHPQWRARWEEESSLDQWLRQSAAPPVSSNFTAQVLAAVDREQRRRGSDARRTRLGWFTRLPRTLRWAVAVVLAAGLVVSLKWLAAPPGGQPGEVLNLVTSMATVPNPEVLRDFEAIRELSTVPSEDWVDMELLVALQ